MNLQQIKSGYSATKKEGLTGALVHYLIDWWLFARDWYQREIQSWLDWKDSSNPRQSQNPNSVDRASIFYLEQLFAIKKELITLDSAVPNTEELSSLLEWETNRVFQYRNENETLAKKLQVK